MPTTSSQCTMRTGRSHTRRTACSAIVLVAGGSRGRRGGGGRVARRWDLDLRELAALLFVSLGSEESGDLEAFRGQQICRAAAACRMVGDRHDRAAFRNPFE